MVFCRGFIYETRSVKESDESDRYNIGVLHQSPGRVSENRISGFTVGSCAGYFLYPEKKMLGCKFPYGEFDEHWIIGFIYTWNPDVDSLHLVSEVEVVVQPKWKIASKSIGTGTTFAIGSIKDIEKLRKGEGVFRSKDEFKNYWIKRGKERRR